MSLHDPDLQRPVTRGDMRTLVLPSGGTIEIPMTKSARNKSVVINPPSRGLSDAVHGSFFKPVLIGVLVGAVVGGAIVWYLHSRA